MGQIKWYKRDPEKALGGMMMLTLEERGAYNTVLDLIYLRDGVLPDDDRFIAGWCGVDVRVWRRIKDRLFSLGKLRSEAGLIRNTKADEVVDVALAKLVQTSYAGQQSANSKAAKSNAKPNKNNNKASTDVGTDVGTDVRQIKIEKEKTLSTNVDNAPADDFDPTKEVFDQGIELLTFAGIGNNKKQREIIGRWRKQARDNDELVLAALSACQVKMPLADPAAWMNRAIEIRMEKMNGRNSQNEEPTDPYVRASLEREAARAVGAGE